MYYEQQVLNLNIFVTGKAEKPVGCSWLNSDTSSIFHKFYTKNFQIDKIFDSLHWNRKNKITQFKFVIKLAVLGVCSIHREIGTWQEQPLLRISGGKDSNAILTYLISLLIAILIGLLIPIVFFIAYQAKWERAVSNR